MSQTLSISSVELLTRFDQDGYVIMPGVLAPHIIEDVREEMLKYVQQQADALMADGFIDDPMSDEPFETRLFKLYEHHMEKAPNQIRRKLHLKGMFGLFFHPAVLDAVELILGKEIQLYPNYTVRPKLPDHAATEVLWHQDAGYTAANKNHNDADPVNNLRMVNVWTPLVPATVENGCMQFVPASHKLGLVKHVHREYYLEIVEPQLTKRFADAVDLELNPGDVVLFSNLLFHRGQPNKTKQVRWSCDWRYQDATQSTMRGEVGHLARSKANPQQAVQSAEQWADLSFV
jgi:ectoine hydroxylase-related dioxygenase (phytanoyl-CoA dioxygenase family)